MESRTLSNRKDLKVADSENKTDRVCISVQRQIPLRYGETAMHSYDLQFIQNSKSLDRTENISNLRKYVHRNYHRGNAAEDHERNPGTQ